jgi:hypothetical protein
MAEPVFMKFGMYIMAPEPISTAYFVNPSRQPVCLYVYPTIVARKRLGKNATVATNTHATLEELLDALFSMRSVLYEKKVGYHFFSDFFYLIFKSSSLIFTSSEASCPVAFGTNNYI